MDLPSMAAILNSYNDMGDAGMIKRVKKTRIFIV
jgi:hypothetical protein